MTLGQQYLNFLLLWDYHPTVPFCGGWGGACHSQAETLGNQIFKTALAVIINTTTASTRPPPVDGLAAWLLGSRTFLPGRRSRGKTLMFS